MNGAGTTYQSFLNPAEAAEEKGGRIGDRTLRTAPAFDAGGLIGAVKGGDGKKLAEQFHDFVTAMNAQITDKEELKAVKDSEDYSSCVTTATDLLFILNPGIGEGVRDLEAGPREKMFDDAVESSMAKSREIQNQERDDKDMLRAQAQGLDAKYWASATGCAMQLQQTVG